MEETILACSKEEEMGRERGFALFQMKLEVELITIMSNNRAASTDVLLLPFSSLADRLIR